MTKNKTVGFKDYTTTKERLDKLDINVLLTGLGVGFVIGCAIMLIIVHFIVVVPLLDLLISS